MINQLKQAGKNVDVVTAYRAEKIKYLPTDITEQLAAETIDAITFFSGRTAAAFMEALPKQGKKWLQNTLITTISPITNQTLGKYGLTADLTASKASGEGVVTALANHWQSQV